MGESSNINTHNIDPIYGRDFLLSQGGLNNSIGTIENPAVKKLFFRGLVKKMYENEFVKKTSNSFAPEYIDKKVDLFVAYVESKIGKFDNINGLTFGHGILELFDKKGESVFRTNSIVLWDNILKGTPEIKKIEEKTRRETEALREMALTDSLFGGSVIVKYVAIGGAVMLGANSALNMTTSWYNSQSRLFNGYQRMSEILLRMPDGTFERVDLSGDETMKSLKNMLVGDRGALKGRTLAILENLGYVFDPIKKSFTHLDRQVFMAASELIQKMSLQELRSKYGLVTATEAQLIETRKALQEAGKTINWKYYTRKSLMGILGNNVMHAIMWPVFFSTFTKHQTNANFVAGLAEWGLFTAGMKVGNKFGKVGGILGKVLAPIVLGGAAAGLGHIGFDHLGGSQLKWEHFNGTDMYDYKRSVVMHALNFAAPEGLDQFNKDREQSIDAGIASFNWTKWFGKWGRKMPLTAGTGITPDITFIQSKVNLGVDPSEWMGGSVNNRNKNQWNIEVYRYGNELKKSIFTLINQYQNTLPPFFPEDTAHKKYELFTQILETHTLSGIGSNFYQLERGQIAVAIISEIGKWKKERSPQHISDIIDNYLSGMYMNDMSFSNEKFRQESEKFGVEGKINALEQYIQNPDEKKYLQTIFGRMQKGERIFEEDVIESNPFNDSARRILSAEHKLFLKLLKNKNTIPWGQEQSQVEIGKVFAGLLDLMSDYVIRRDSLDRLSKIDGEENGGYWKENEWVKSKFK